MCLLVQWDYIVNTVIPVLGAAAIIKGWQEYNDEPPKLTEEDSVTHTDYISGNYQRDLEERQELINSYRTRGRWLVITGSTLFLGGLYLLSRGALAEADR
jgi:hypothetical protein